MSAKRQLQKAIKEIRDIRIALPNEARRVIDNYLERIERNFGELRRSSSIHRTTHEAIQFELADTKRQFLDESSRFHRLEEKVQRQEAEIIRLQTELSVPGIRLAGSDFGEFHLVKAKCLACGLHFLLCTWHPGSHTYSNLHCPECGQADGSFLVWRDQVKGFIFELVPGSSGLIIGD